MALSFSSAGTDEGGASPIDVPYPSTVNADDILILVLATDSAVAPDLPSGWTNIATDTAAISYLGYRVCYKRATGSESGTLSCSVGSTFLWGIMYRFIDVISSGSPFSGMTQDLIGSSPKGDSTVAVSCVSGQLKVAITITTNNVTVTNASDGDWTVRGNVKNPYQNDMSFSIVTSLTTSSTNGGFTSSSTYKGTVGFVLLPNIITEQEGYRFRNDDGSESTATWKAAQDTDISLNKETAARLRISVDVTGDLPSSQMTLQYKRTDESDWKNVE